MARRKDRPTGPLDARSQAILRAVIEEYVSTAQPVGFRNTAIANPPSGEVIHCASFCPSVSAMRGTLGPGPTARE